MSYISQSQITRLGHRVVYELRLSISRRLMNMSVERIDQLGQPTILATLTKDITAISQAFNSLPFVVLEHRWYCSRMGICFGCLRHFYRDACDEYGIDYFRSPVNDRISLL